MKKYGRHLRSKHKLKKKRKLNVVKERERKREREMMMEYINYTVEKIKLFRKYRIKL